MRSVPKRSTFHDDPSSLAIASAADDRGTTQPNKPAPPLLEVVDLSKTYTTRRDDRITALAPTSLALADGEFVSIVGPSGCGKSTLMKLIAGISRPSSGQILYQGQPVTRTTHSRGVVFQTPVLLPWLTVLENVLLPIRVLRLDLSTARERACDLLALVDLEGFESKYPLELSGGMQQRVSIVRSLIHNPGLLLMDEPLGALDALTRERMGMELQRIWLANRKTVFFITHSIFEAVFLSDRVLVMSQRPGRIVREFSIPFGRPRNFELTVEPDFGQLVEQIRDLLGAKTDA